LRLVFELAKIHDLAHGRVGIGRDFNQIQTGVDRHIKSFGRVNDTDILTFSANQADFRCANFVVDSGSCVARRRRVMWSSGYRFDPSIVSR